jgi:hypothetical protein
LPRAGHAEAPNPPGDTAWGLPGISRIGVPGAAKTRLSLAGTAGYGFTESQGEGDSAHHRAFGTAAVGFVPIRDLALGLRFDGRYDHHGDDGTGSHGAAIGDPRLLIRYGHALGDGSFRVGAEATAWLPGKDAPSVSFDATTLDAKLLASWSARGGPTIAALAGFRWDNSSNAAPDVTRLRFGDRVALGLSDSKAVLAGIGVAVPIGKTEILGEVTADLLIGAKAPALGDSPMRVTGGVRHAIGERLAVEGLLEVSPSGRPSLTATSPLVPLEPRVSVMFGVRYALTGTSPPPPPPPAERETPPPPPPAAVAPPTSAPLVVRVETPDGAPVANATVDVIVGEKTSRAEAGDAGSYGPVDAPFGTLQLTVTAEGFAPVEKEVVFDPKNSAPIVIRLEALAPSGQLRGLVRTFGGKGLAATIHVAPIDKDVTADAQGAFTLDLPPGNYEVVIDAPRFKSQHRKVHVDQNGVTVLNAELFEGK